MSRKSKKYDNTKSRMMRYRNDAVYYHIMSYTQNVRQVRISYEASGDFYKSTLMQLK